MTSTIKVQNIKHTNDTTAMTIATSGDITMNAKVFNANQPSFKIYGRTNTSYTPPINNSTAFQFAATEFATGGFTVSNTFSRVTVPVSGRYYIKVIIQHSGPSANTETRYMNTNIRKNGSTNVARQLSALVAVADGWGSGNSYHPTSCETLVDLAASDYLEVVLSRSSSSDWNGVIYEDGNVFTQFFGYLIG